MAPAGPSARADFFEAWLAAGRHGTMDWMARHVPLRTDPAALVPGASSVLCVADRYGPPEDEPLQPGHGRIARYAQGRDYHRHMKRRLHALCDALRSSHPDDTFRACVDTAPVLERELAAAAGLGNIGRNTMLIQQGVGSWLLLGEIITTARFESTAATPEDPCGTCTRCLDACPTDALTAFELDASRCISYLTIEHRGSIDEGFHEAIGEWIFGCDICQEVCPHNQPTNRTLDAPVDEAYSERSASLGLLDVLRWGPQDRIAALAGTSATRASLDMWRRNAAIAARNQLDRTPDAELSSMLDELSGDPHAPEMVRQAAVSRSSR